MRLAQIEYERGKERAGKSVNKETIMKRLRTLCYFADQKVYIIIIIIINREDEDGKKKIV